jgi:hypothetical protein
MNLSVQLDYTRLDVAIPKMMPLQGTAGKIKPENKSTH